MSAEVAEAIRQTRRTLAEETWVPRDPWSGEICLVKAVRPWNDQVLNAFVRASGSARLVAWNDRQTDVGAVLGMTLQALIAELCKPTLAPRTTEA